MSSSAHTGTLTPPPRPPHPPFPGGEGGASDAGRVAPEQREQPRPIVRALRRRPLRTEHPAFTAPGAIRRAVGSSRGSGLPAARISITSSPAITCPATSTAHHPSHGDGESHLSGGVASSTASNPSSARTKPSGITEPPPGRGRRQETRSR